MGIVVYPFWAPANFGRSDWEFGVVSTTLDGLPLGTTGVGLFAVGVGVWLATHITSSLGAG